MSLLVVGLADPMWLPVDLVLAALLSSAFELAWVAERGGLSADGDPSDLDTDSLDVPALAPSAAPAFSPGGELWREDRVNPQPRGAGEI